VSRPYGSFQIDRLEAEFERASDEDDGDALRHLKDELARRKQTPRVSRLLQQLSDTASQEPHRRDRLLRVTLRRRPGGHQESRRRNAAPEPNRRHSSPPGSRRRR
jgi:hypothetical protein